MIRPVATSMLPAYCDAARASGSASTITLTKRSGYYWVLGSVCWAYRSTPTNGLLTIAASGTTVFSQPVTVAGPGFSPWMNPRLLPSITAGQTYTITLADGTAIKDLNVEAWEIPEDII